MYGMFVPDDVDPKKLSRSFLLLVSHAFYILQLIAHLDKNLYQELYAIYKMRLSQKRNEKWTQYKIQVEETILENVKNYAAVDR